jgi:16S rRNA G966 N2-methylase RsmD
MDTIIKLQRKSNEYILSKYKNKNKNYINLNYYHQYQKLKTENRISCKFDWDLFKINGEPYFFTLFNIQLGKCISIQSHNLTKNFFLYQLADNQKPLRYIGKVSDIKNKYDIILANTLTPKLYSKVVKYPYCDRENILYKYRLYTLYYLFDLLKENGKFLITLYGYCDTAIEILYLLTFMFDYVFKSSMLVCYNFNSIISQKDIKELINNRFTINPKNQLSSLIKHFESNLKHEVKLFKLQNNYCDDRYTISILEDLIILFYYTNPYQKNDIYRYIEYYFYKIYYDNLLLCENIIYKYIVYIINKFDCKNCLEVGMGFGIYSFFILCNRKTKLTSIDINQKKFYNYGIKLLKKFKFNKNHILIKDKPNNILKYNQKFDFIFIDFYFNSDINLEYYDELLEKNGIIILHNYSNDNKKFFNKYTKIYNNKILVFQK